MKTSLAFTVLLASASFLSADHYVAQNGQTPSGSYTSWETAASNINDAVSKAVAGSVVHVSTGRYTFTAATNAVVDIINKSLELRAAGERSQVIIDGENTYRGIYVNINTYDSKRVVIDGFTIINCNFANGAGISFRHTSVSSGTGIVRNCTISNNVANAGSNLGGGGIYVQGTQGTYTSAFYTIISNCTIIGNSAEEDKGAGIYINLANTEIVDCLVEDNYAVNNGGGFHVNGDTWIHNCQIRNNYSDNHGGGIFIYGVNGTQLVADCQITGNTASNSSGLSGYGCGGGLRLQYSSRTVISNCLIAGNTCYAGPGVSVSGGGGACMDAGLITHCAILSNRVYGGGANGGGGVLMGFEDSINYLSIVRNCLVAYNNAEVGHGGGIADRYARNQVENCTIVSNRINAAGSYYGGGLRLAPAATVNRYAWVENTIIYHNTGPDKYSNINYQASTFYTNCCSAPLSQMPGSNNTDAEPLFVNPDAGDFHLQSASPCVNAGVYQDWMASAFDLDGRRRRDRFTGIVDMGCYEHIAHGAMFGIH